MNYDIPQPYFIEKTEQGYYLTRANGFAVEKDELLEICTHLIKYAENYGDELEKRNKRLREDWYSVLNEPPIEEAPKKEPKKAYVYFLECGGRYKIGLSKDVQRRIKELDKRPFPVKLICQSKPTEYAWEVEQDIHAMLSTKRIDGEWYELDDFAIDMVCTIINDA